VQARLKRALPAAHRKRALESVRAGSVSGVQGFFSAAGPALESHLNNEPPEWGQGTTGLQPRLANRFGRFALQETYEARRSAVLQHEVRYLRSRLPVFFHGPPML